MKTLDEVIEELNIWDAYGDEYPDVFYDTQTIRVALHYLREYRTEQKILSDSKEHYEYWEHKYYAELEKNDPLSWDELRQMDEKPVWATFDNENGTWYVAKVYDDEVVLYEWGQEFGERISGTWDYTPKRWQAYRKERE